MKKLYKSTSYKSFMDEDYNVIKEFSYINNESISSTESKLDCLIMFLIQTKEDFRNLYFSI